MQVIRDKFRGLAVGQLAILALARFTEPIAFYSIFPYIYFMVERFNIAKTPDEINFYAGFLSGSFAASQAVTSLFWGTIADRYGRKIVLTIGLFGSCAGSLIFGLSNSFYLALAARCLSGLLNGNVGVIRTCLGEISTNRKHDTIVFSMNAVIWQLGSIVGPMVGGYLAMPVSNHPKWFEIGSQMEKLLSHFPFLLPNFIVSSSFLLGGIILILFFRETHKHLKDRMDPGLRLGKFVVTIFVKDKKAEIDVVEESSSESTSLLNDPESSLNSASSAAKPAINTTPWSEVLTRPILAAIMGNVILSLHTVIADDMLPLLLSTPVNHDNPSKFPFRLVGGLGLDSSITGIHLSIQGFICLVLMLVAFPLVDMKFGTIGPYRLLLTVYPILYFLLPYLVLLSESSNTLVQGSIFILLTAKSTATSFIYPQVFLLLNNAVFKRDTLARVNSFSTVSMAIVRALGPFVWGIILTQSQKLAAIELAWWSIGVISILGCIQSFYIHDYDLKQLQE